MSDSQSVMRAQRRKKERAVEAFGGKCSICGYKRCINALEFHHLSDKDECASYIIMRWSWKRSKKELDKCILLCSNCHREVHYKVINVDLQQYCKHWITQECPQCHENFDTKEYEQKYCSAKCKHMADRKVVRPSKSELKKLLDQQTSWLKLGRMFGVSDNSVRKWARRYELIT